MAGGELDPEWIERVRAMPHSKRGRALFEYLVEHGTITTDGIRTELGEAHPPSTVRDLRDRGVPVVLENTTVNGRRMGLYRLDPDAPLRPGLSGRTGISKKFHQELIKHYGSFCQICGAPFEPRYLQPDHRIPQRIAGDEADHERDVADYMPVCGPCNRKKSYECEHCPNWEVADPAVCTGCYWAHPEGYDHVATRLERRLEMTWSGEEETQEYDRLVAEAEKAIMSAAEYLKGLVGKLWQKRRGG